MRGKQDSLQMHALPALLRRSWRERQEAVHLQQRGRQPRKSFLEGNARLCATHTAVSEVFPCQAVQKQTGPKANKCTVKSNPAFSTLVESITSFPFTTSVVVVIIIKCNKLQRL